MSVNLTMIRQAASSLQGVARRTPLEYNELLSEEYGCEVYLKREDLQPVRSYKLRGAYHKISSLSSEEQQRGVVCASAGNHAQGVAFSCRKLGIHGTIYMPVTTPEQKINQVRFFGKEWVRVVLEGDTFDDAQRAALAFCRGSGAVFVHPFDDELVIAGQGTVGLEILEDMPVQADYILVPVGGGGLAAGLTSCVAELCPAIQVIGVEPEGAPSMSVSISHHANTELDTIDRFVDGAAVKRVGDLTFAICHKYLADMVVVPEGKVCTTILKLYNQQGMVVEPAGALTITALHQLRDKLAGKKVVCVVSGSNNDIVRMAEIRERSLLYEGLKHFFVIRFPQRAGALKDFVSEVLGPTDDIVHFEYMKKNNRESGPALIGIEIGKTEDLRSLQERLNKLGFSYEYLNKNNDLLQVLV